MSSIPNMDDKTIAASKLQVKRTESHIYFFGYESSDPEVCFQQLFPSYFEDEGLSLRTSEHYMMKGLRTIRSKKLGYGACDDIVEKGSWLEFSQNESLKKILLNMGEKVIVEASPSDRIWGIGFDAENAGGNERV